MLKLLSSTAFAGPFRRRCRLCRRTGVARAGRQERHVRHCQGNDALHLRQGQPGKSACNGPCATNWPPALVADDAKATGDWTIVMRDDGLKQWAYKGKPVYGWAKDTKPGDTTGDGFMNGAWHIAKP